jgi:hypothetical protein
LPDINQLAVVVAHKASQPPGRTERLPCRIWGSFDDLEHLEVLAQEILPQL